MELSSLTPGGEVRVTPSLLIIEADANQLRADGITGAIDQLEGALRPMVEAKTLRLARLQLKNAADVEWARCVAPLVRYDGAILVGHGSVGGLQAAPGQLMDWSAVGESLAPVKPRALLSISCFGARRPRMLCSERFRSSSTCSDHRHL